MWKLFAAVLIGWRVLSVWDDGTVTEGPFIPVPTTVTSSTTTTTLPSVRVATWGYFDYYDPGTATVWPTKAMPFLVGGVDRQASLVATMKQRAVAAGNASQKLVFYRGLGAMDSRCVCDEQFVGDALLSAHPEYGLKNSSGQQVYTNDAGGARVRAMDIGNPNFIADWITRATGEMARSGWDGVLADYVQRCNGFWGWTNASKVVTKPINPRTKVVYTCADYRRDLAVALETIRAAFHARGKVLVGNHSAAWWDTADSSGTFSDPLIRRQVDAMDAVQVEDCVYMLRDSPTPPHTEAAWLDQLRYASYANQHGVAVLCQGYGSALGTPEGRSYVVATSLLTKEGRSAVGQINSVARYDASLYGIDCGPPLAGYECINADGAVTATGCPGAGLTYRRRFQRCVAVVNPVHGAIKTTPLGRSTSCGTTVTLTGPAGRVCQ